MKSKARKENRGESATRKDESSSAVKRQFKLQKKLMKRVRFFTKVEEDGHLLSARETESKKRRKTKRGRKGLKIASLSALADSLPSVDSTPLSAFSINGKTRHGQPTQKVVLNETKQLAAVLSHPEFQENPFLAIHRHLNNTLPADEGFGKVTAPKGNKKPKPRRKTASSATQMEE